MINESFIGEKVDNIYKYYCDFSRLEVRNMECFLFTMMFLCKYHGLKIKLLPLKQGMVFDSL